MAAAVAAAVCYFSLNWFRIIFFFNFIFVVDLLCCVVSIVGTHTWIYVYTGANYLCEIGQVANGRHNDDDDYDKKCAGAILSDVDTNRFQVEGEFILYLKWQHKRQ